MYLFEQNIILILIILILFIFNNLRTNLAGVQILQGDHLSEKLNNSILLIKLDKLSKSELLEKFKELSSQKSLENLKSETEVNFKDFYVKLIKFFSKFYSLLTKITLFTIIFKILKKIRLVRFIFGLFNSLLALIFGIAYLDIYGFEDIYNKIVYYWNQYIDLIHETKIYKVFSKFLKSFKEEDIIKSEVKEIKKPEIKKEEIENNSESLFSSTWENETKHVEENRENTWDFRKIDEIDEIDKPFYKNPYFIVTLTIVSASLIYYYSDEIVTSTYLAYEWLINHRPWRRRDGDNGPDNIGGGNSDNNSTPTGSNIQLEDLTTENLEKLEHDKEVLSKNMDDLKGKGKVLTSPSLEDLNKQASESWGNPIEEYFKLEETPGSPSSSSSIETITPFNTKSTVEAIIEKAPESSNNSSIETIIESIKPDWTTKLDNETKITVDYVEKHFPKTELDDNVENIRKMIKEVELSNMNFSAQAKDLGGSSTELFAKLEIAKNTNAWVEEMLEKLNNLE